MPNIETVYSPAERAHRIDVFAIEQSLRSDVREIQHIAKALQDQTEYQPWVCCKRPIIEPLSDSRFGVRMRKEGRVMPRQWPAPWPSFESIAERLLLMREHDRHIKRAR